MIGGASLTAVSQYRFDKSFLGVNGVHIEAGFTTPDPDEALLKTKAVRQAKNAYVLADPSKFGEISFAAFAALGDAAIITTEAEELAFDNYQEKTVVKVVKP